MMFLVTLCNTAPFLLPPTPLIRKKIRLAYLLFSPLPPFLRYFFRSGFLRVLFSRELQSIQCTREAAPPAHFQHFLDGRRFSHQLLEKLPVSRVVFPLASPPLYFVDPRTSFFFSLRILPSNLLSVYHPWPLRPLFSCFLMSFLDTSSFFFLVAGDL